MKIAFLTPEYPYAKVRNTAGLGTSIRHLVSALVSKGVAVTVFVYAQEKSEIFVENGIAFHLIEDKKYPFAKWFFYRKYIQKYCNRIIKKEKIEVLEAPDWTGITAFMNFNVPLLIRFHGSDTYFCHLEKRKQKLKNYWFEKRAIDKATAYIAPTRFAGALSAKLFGIKNKTIQTIHHGLGLENFENSNPESYEKGVILYVGTLIRKKGVLELPGIFNLVRQQHPEARLILIGGDASDIETQSNSTWELLKKKFDSEDLKKVTYLGPITYQEVQHHIKNAQLCVFPTFAETLGMVTIESMALQKPVVNSNMEWSKELIVDGESGFLVNPKDAALFAEKILALINDPVLSQSIGKEARIRVEKLFDIEQIAQENIAFYQSLIN
ncbi:glycosyltransferase family 4 protein [Flavobacterium granuli]|uniref:Glycosyltransferase involved in cell wall biosynthesis n=1 Tax=Flavobacterium granuli TaxID=280093 RepID=A0A1M5QL57_9FLAO|nr:glycosyltransferase family 4 protein [Flavobacterium granuli]PRZ20069.1 glycosyltransferase involved in cell wall biosynthesis [Flavobacterium granuli]SHH14852.1 Glycosyltransferase involved in cell wall bisynthesis [Flavobacterium granuli]